MVTEVYLQAYCNFIHCIRDVMWCIRNLFDRATIGEQLLLRGFASPASQQMGSLRRLRPVSETYNIAYDSDSQTF
jgi:hypothetical protein